MTADDLLGGDWLGAVLVALAAVGSAVVLALVVLVLGGAYSGGTGGFFAALGLLVGAAFGADATVGAGVTDASGGLSGGVSIGAFPLTLTFAAVGIAAWLYWRRVRSLRLSLVQALVHAVRSGILAAVLVLVVCLVTRGSWDAASAALTGGGGGQVYANAAQGALMAFLLVTGSCAACTLLFRGWLPGPVGAFRDLIAGPVRALTWGSLFAVIATLIAAVTVVFTTNIGGGVRAELAVILAALPNLAIDGLLLGLGAGLDVSGSGSGLLATATQSSASTTVHITDLTATNGLWWLDVVGAVTVVILTGLALTGFSQNLSQARRQLLVQIPVAAGAGFVGAWLAGVYVDAQVGSSAAGEFIGVNAWLALVIGAIGGLFAAIVGSALGPWVLGSSGPPHVHGRSPAQGASLPPPAVGPGAGFAQSSGPETGPADGLQEQ